MVTEGPSVLSLMTAGLYAVVVLCCVFAARASAIRPRLPRHVQIWTLIALLFIVLAAFRVTALEEFWRTLLRAALQAEGAYEQRRYFQRPIVAATFTIASGLAFWWVYRFARVVQGRRNAAVFLAQSCAFVMIVLVFLRVISLHAIDAILYGPLKPNWIVDVGASVLVGASALYYFWLVRGKR